MKKSPDIIALRSVLAGLFLLFLCIPAEPVLAHAFPDHADPKVGATLAAPPARVRIWFDGVLEPAFSTISVQDKAGKVVDNRDGRVNASAADLLEVTLPRLASGTYRVIWSVVARDGYRTAGDYSFGIK
jgi:copper resistance protein C